MDGGDQPVEDITADIAGRKARAATAVTRLFAGWTAGTSLLGTSRLPSLGQATGRIVPVTSAGMTGNVCFECDDCF